MQCPHCGFDLSTPALARVRYICESWAGSPVPCLFGPYSDLRELELAGYATRDKAGWFIPTEKYPVV